MEINISWLGELCQIWNWHKNGVKVEEVLVPWEQIDDLFVSGKSIILGSKTKEECFRVFSSWTPKNLLSTGKRFWFRYPKVLAGKTSPAVSQWKKLSTCYYESIASLEDLTSKTIRSLKKGLRYFHAKSMMNLVHLEDFISLRYLFINVAKKVVSLHMNLTVKVFTLLVRLAVRPSFLTCLEIHRS